MMFVSIPDKMVCYRGVRIQCNYNSIGILCAIKAVPYEMKIAIKLAILLMVVVGDHNVLNLHIWLKL